VAGDDDAAVDQDRHQKAESGDAIRDFEAAWRVPAKGTSIGRSLLLA
jgi:hypothetical protein